MPLYETSRSHVFPGHSRVVRPGETIELEADEADRLMVYEPGLLRLTRHTTQAEITDIRSAEATDQPEPTRKRGKK